MNDFELHSVRIFVYDWDRCVDFYRDQIGLKLVFADSESGWAHFEVGPVHIGIERCVLGEPEADALVGRFVGISLAVSDIQHTYKELSSAGVQFSSPPTKQTWGGVLAHFKDPDGNIVTLLGGDA